MSAHITIGALHAGVAVIRPCRAPVDLDALCPSGPTESRECLWFTTWTTQEDFDALCGLWAALGGWRSWPVTRDTRIRKLDADALDAMAQVTAAWRRKHPAAVPVLDGNEANGVLLRLEWVRRSSELAMRRCARPALGIC